MQTLNIILPTNWYDLTDNQLHLVYKLFAEDYTAPEGISTPPMFS